MLANKIPQNLLSWALSNELTLTIIRNNISLVPLLDTGYINKIMRNYVDRSDLVPI